MGKNKIKVIKGDKYGRLEIIKEIEKKGKRRMVLCVCDCGNKKETPLTSLRTGSTRSCGCLCVDLAKERGRTHGMSKTRFYLIWCNMKKRCNSKKLDSYKNYGGRGITYDPKWEKFENFHEDMFISYNQHLNIYGEKQTTIDRIDNDGNYCKENCRRVNRIQQGRNKRNNVMYKGKCLSQWCEDLSLSYKAIGRRIDRGWSWEDALELKK